MNKLVLSLSAIFALFFLTGCFHTTSKVKKEVQTNGRGVFGIKLKTLRGKTITLKKYKGQPLVINSWAVWCGFCKKELSDFAKTKGGIDKNIKIIAVNRAESKSKIQNFINKLKHKKKLIFLRDPEDKFYRKIGGFAMPETVFINKKGEIIFHKRGPMNAEEFKSKLNLYFDINE